MSRAKIHYLYHSSFAVETKDHLLIFDYFKDKNKDKESTLENGVISKEILKTKKSVYVFASHCHEDHFSSLIFDWIDTNPNIKYILSSDIENNESYPEHIRISEGENIETGSLSLKAFGSTDAGISFLLEVDGISIFHAGDLNWWHWFDESDEYNAEMEKAFKFQIDKLKDEHIDIAFFPVDPRLKESYYLGGEYFIKKICPKLFIPMHFANRPEITKEFADRIDWPGTKVVEIYARGQEIQFE